MTPAELQAKLTELLALPAETEWIEFKEAKNGYDFADMGKYLSALSNEANLKGQPFGGQKLRRPMSFETYSRNCDEKERFRKLV